MAKIKGHVIINGFKQTINNWVPWLPNGSIERPVFRSWPLKKAFISSSATG
jgi:hypothetical protein